MKLSEILHNIISSNKIHSFKREVFKKRPTWFKPGDIVKCLTDQNWRQIKEGKKYKVSPYLSTWKPDISLDDGTIECLHFRFEKANN